MKGDKKDLWYLDSGCSRHMTRDKTKFGKLELKEEGFVTYGDKNKGKILGNGVIGNGSSFNIKNMLLVEVNKISALNNRLKGLNKWLENRVSQLEKGTSDLKTDFEHLEMIYSTSTYCFRNQSVEKPCENCTVLKNQVKYLIKTCAKFTRGEANLKDVLGLKTVCLTKLDLVIILLFKRKPRSSLVSFQKVCQVICHSFHATTVCKMVMLLRTVMLENMMFLKGL